MMPKDKLNRLSGAERLGQNRESEYLGAEDIDDGAEPILTIDAIWNGQVTLQRGKENKDVMSFVEEKTNGINNVRPLIVNATNRKTLRKLFGSVQASVLTGKRIQLYVDDKVRDPETGGMRDGIRIRPFKPREQKPVEPCADCGGVLTAFGSMSPAKLAEYTMKKYKRVLCSDCAKKASEATEPSEPAETEENNNAE